jgi:hypothetical protein
MDMNLKKYSQSLEPTGFIFWFEKLELALWNTNKYMSNQHFEICHYFQTTIAALSNQNVPVAKIGRNMM